MNSAGYPSSSVETRPFVGLRRPKLVAQLLHGLGNRLSGLLSCLVIAEVYEMDLEVIWARDGVACDALLTELLETDGLEGVVVRETPEPQLNWVHYSAVSREMVQKAKAEKSTLAIQVFNLFGDELVGHYHFYERLRVRLARLRPVSSVREIIQRVPMATIGIHVRMTDHLPSRIVTPRWCYREALRELLLARPDAKVYVCSDTPQIVRELVGVDPQRVFATPEVEAAQRVRRSELPALKVALAEIWLLSRCTIIVGAPPSSFALLASLFSGGVFIRLSAWPRALAWRLERLAWPLYRSVSYDLQKHAWTWRGGTGKGLQPQRLGGWILTSLLCSRFYQDWPRWGLRAPLIAHLRKSLPSR